MARGSCLTMTIHVYRGFASEEQELWNSPLNVANDTGPSTQRGGTSMSPSICRQTDSSEPGSRCICANKLSSSLLTSCRICDLVMLLSSRLPHDEISCAAAAARVPVGSSACMFNA